MIPSYDKSHIIFFNELVVSRIKSLRSDYNRQNGYLNTKLSQILPNKYKLFIIPNKS